MAKAVHVRTYALRRAPLAMKKYLLPVAIIFVLCLMLGAGFTIMSIKLAAVQQANVKAQQELLVENLRTPVHNALQSARLGAESLGTSPLSLAVLAEAPAHTSPSLVLSLQKMALLFPYVEFLAIIDTKKMLRLASFPMLPETKVVDDRYVELSLRGIREFSSPYPSPVTGNMVIAATSPIADNEHIVGVAVAVINVQKLASATTNRFELGTTGYISLLNNNGTVILHPASSMVGLNIAQTPLGQQIMRKESGQAFGMLYEGGEKWVAFTTLPRTGWKLLLSLTYAEYMRPITLLRNTTLLAGIAMMLLVMLGVGWLTILLIRRMERARIAARESIRAKDNFLANMSHEIRTPMNGIIGLTHLMGKTSLTPQQADYLTKIQFSSNSLLRLISDILDISKIEAHKLEVECIYFRLNDVLTHMQNNLLDQAALRGLLLECHVAPDVPPLIRSDPYRLGQILLNIVGNGLKFTSSGGVRVAVTASPSPARAEQPDNGAANYTLSFAVTDTGIGMTTEEMQRLFQPFSQADTSTTRKFGGTGLGLVICKHLAEMLGGTVTMTSVPAQGSTCTCTIACEGRLSEDGLDPALLSSLNPTAMPTAADTVDTAPLPPQAHCNVLVAEDNEINQQIARELLENMGACVDIADSGLTAIELVVKKHFDIIFMDIQMPEMDGITATQKIRAMGLCVPIVAMTAHAMAGDRNKSLAAGMNDHITKPINPEILREIFYNYCPRRVNGGHHAA